MNFLFKNKKKDESQNNQYSARENQRSRCQKMSNNPNGGGTDAAGAHGTQKGELESGRALAAKCHTWAQALILYHPYY